MITAITIRNEDEFNQVREKLIEGGIEVPSQKYNNGYTFFYIDSQTALAQFLYSDWPCNKIVSAEKFLIVPTTLDGWHKPIREVTMAEVCEKFGCEVKIKKDWDYLKSKDRGGGESQ